MSNIMKKIVLSICVVVCASSVSRAATGGMVAAVNELSARVHTIKSFSVLEAQLQSVLKGAEGRIYLLDSNSQALSLFLLHLLSIDGALSVKCRALAAEHVERCAKILAGFEASRNALEADRFKRSFFYQAACFNQKLLFGITDAEFAHSCDARYNNSGMVQIVRGEHVLRARGAEALELFIDGLDPAFITSAKELFMIWYQYHRLQPVAGLDDFDLLESEIPDMEEPVESAAPVGDDFLDALDDEACFGIGGPLGVPVGFSFDKPLRVARTPDTVSLSGNGSDGSDISGFPF